MTHFLIVYDRLGGKLLTVRSLEDGSEAIHARFDLEREREHNRDVEIVVLSARSMNEVRRTHARYFQDPSALIDAALAHDRA